MMGNAKPMVFWVAWLLMWMKFVISENLFKRFEERKALTSFDYEAMKKKIELLNFLQMQYYAAFLVPT